MWVTRASFRCVVVQDVPPLYLDILLFMICTMFNTHDRQPELEGLITIPHGATFPANPALEKTSTCILNAILLTRV